MKIITSLIIPVSCILMLVMVTGCMTATANASLPHIADPENAIKIWIDAVNARDYPKLYALSPEYIRQGITMKNFIKAQDGNPMMATGSQIVDYQVLDRKTGSDNATFTVQLILQISGSGANATVSNIPVYLKFTEFFEQGNWHVWTDAP